MTATRAWIGLVVLSAASTVLVALGLSGPAFTLAILALSWGKARLILDHYLGLARAPAWRRGFALALTATIVLFLVLALAA